MYNELVTIVVPVYNPPLKKLTRCIQSILKQSYKNIELIIVDDGSNNFIKRYLRQINDNRVNILYQKNSGVSVARNKGILMSKGKYVSFVDADDCVDKDWILSSVEFLKLNYDIVFGRVIQCNEYNLKDVQRTDYAYAYKKYKNRDIVKVQELLLLNDAASPLPNLPYLDLGPCGKLYKKDIIKDISFPINITLAEDQVFNHRVIKRCNKVVVTNTKAYYYIKNSKSVGHTLKKDAVNMMMDAMRLIYKELISEKELNAFYYSVILNIQVGISLEFKSQFFNDFNVMREIYKDRTFPLYTARKNINISLLPGKKSKLKVFIFKYHLEYFKYLIQHCK